jgi:Alpha/beta hydrolase domain
LNYGLGFERVNLVVFGDGQTRRFARLARRYAVLAASLCLLVAAAPTRAASLDQVTQIAVPGSVPVLGADPTMRQWGFTEREYTVSGSANLYSAGPDGQAQVAARDISYVTRMLVRRPESDEGASDGTVVLELLDPSNGWDGDQIWRYSREHLLREGTTWVGLSIDPGALGNLNANRPDRYGNFAMPSSGLAWDIVSQVAGTLRDRRNRQNPLRFDRPKRVILAGYGRAAEYLVTYQNVFHWTNARPDGSPTVGGYLIAGAGVVARSIPSPHNGTVANAGRLVVERDVPVIRVQSETDLTQLGALDARQSDNAHFRLWEVAGAARIDASQRARLDAVWGRDIPGYTSANCGEPMGQIPLRYAVNAAIHALARWNGRGLGPSIPRIRMNSDGAIIRDSDGNALGGARLPLIDVPTGRNGPNGSGPGNCNFSGSFTSFSRAELQARYPTNAFYLNKLRAAANDAVADRVMVRADLHVMLREARSSSPT